MGKSLSLVSRLLAGAIFFSSLNSTLSEESDFFERFPTIKKQIRQTVGVEPIDKENFYREVLNKAIDKGESVATEQIVDALFYFFPDSKEVHEKHEMIREISERGIKKFLEENRPELLRDHSYSQDLNPENSTKTNNQSTQLSKERRNPFFFSEEEARERNITLEEKIIPGTQQHWNLVREMQEEIKITPKEFQIGKYSFDGEEAVFGTVLFETIADVIKAEEIYRDMGFKTRRNGKYLAIANDEDLGPERSHLAEDYFRKLSSSFNFRKDLTEEELKKIRQEEITSYREVTLEIRKKNDAANLKCIGQGIELYIVSNPNNPKLPSDLGELLEGRYCYDPKTFVTPGSKTPPPSSAEDILRGNCDYVYIPRQLKEIRDKKVPVIITFPGNLGGNFVHVLRGDLNTVDSYENPPQEILELIERYGRK